MSASSPFQCITIALELPKTHSGCFYRKNTVGESSVMVSPVQKFSVGKLDPFTRMTSASQMVIFRSSHEESTSQWKIHDSK